MQDPQPALATQQAEEELQSTVVPFSLDKRPEGKRLIYSGRCSALSPCETTVKMCSITCFIRPCTLLGTQTRSPDFLPPLLVCVGLGKFDCCVVNWC